MKIGLNSESTFFSRLTLLPEKNINYMSFNLHKTKTLSQYFKGKRFAAPMNQYRQSFFAQRRHADRCSSHFEKKSTKNYFSKQNDAIQEIFFFRIFNTM